VVHTWLRLTPSQNLLEISKHINVDQNLQHQHVMWPLRVQLVTFFLYLMPQRIHLSLVKNYKDKNLQKEAYATFYFLSKQTRTGLSKIYGRWMCIWENISCTKCNIPTQFTIDPTQQSPYPSKGGKRIKTQLPNQQRKAKNESKGARKTRQPRPWDMNTMTTV